ncbi:MAG: FAD-dependent oxidoreductase [Steroidobacteraceae bacterium]
MRSQRRHHVLHRHDGADLNQAYVESAEAERERIRAAYRDYARGLLYFWQTDPRFGGLNQKVAAFGFCKDEFTDRGGWPHQLYVRAARRMVGEYVMNENDVMQNGRRPPISDPVGFGSFSIDIHTVRYHAAPATWPDGSRRDALVIEGFLVVNLPDFEPYPVSYRALIPRAEDAVNLLNPVTLSATHVAYASLRMEPTYMILGEAAGTAAALAVELRQDVQSVDYGMLRRRLLANGARLVN